MIYRHHDHDGDNRRHLHNQSYRPAIPCRPRYHLGMAVKPIWKLVFVRCLQRILRELVRWQLDFTPQWGAENHIIKVVDVSADITGVLKIFMSFDWWMAGIIGQQCFTLQMDKLSSRPSWLNQMFTKSELCVKVGFAKTIEVQFVSNIFSSLSQLTGWFLTSLSPPEKREENIRKV